MIKQAPRMWWFLIGGVLIASCDCGSDAPPRFDGGNDAARHDASHMDATLIPDANSDDDATAPDSARPPLDASFDAGFWTSGCRSSQCDLVDNGCAAQDFACYYVPPRPGAAPQPACVRAGDNADNSICTTQEQCAPGLGCDPSNRCRRYCCSPGSAEGCPTDQACLLEFRDSQDRSLGVGLCQDCDACDPITGTGCDTDEACYPASNDGACNLCATPRVRGNAGAACTTHSDCRAGLGCILFEPPRCMRFCSVSANDCGDQLVCTAIGYSDAPDLGFCDSL